MGENDTMPGTPIRVVDVVPRVLVDKVAGEMIAELNRLRALNAELLAACKLVRDRWTFSNAQRHTHTWHDWADCKPVIDAAISKAEGLRDE